jgi:hypothetical protein
LALATTDAYNPLFAAKNIIIAQKLILFLKSFQTIFTSYRGPTPEPHKTVSETPVYLNGLPTTSPAQPRVKSGLDPFTRRCCARPSILIPAPCFRPFRFLTRASGDRSRSCRGSPRTPLTYRSDAVFTRAVRSRSTCAGVPIRRQWRWATDISRRACGRRRRVCDGFIPSKGRNKWRTYNSPGGIRPHRHLPSPGGRGWGREKSTLPELSNSVSPPAEPEVYP